MGVVSTDGWRMLQQLGEVAWLQAALGCARRGDARSLTALCQVLADTGPADLLWSGKPVDLVEMESDYHEIEHLLERDDDASRRAAVPMMLGSWKDVTLERCIAMCLARPIEDARVVMPHNQYQDHMDFFAGATPAFHASIEEDRQALLQAAIGLFSGIPATPLKEDGPRRLFGAVTSVVAYPGIVELFANAGQDVHELLDEKVRATKLLGNQSMSASVQALLMANPVAALALYRAEPLVQERQDELWQAFISEGKGQGVNMVDFVRTVAQPDDPRLLAAMELCQRVCTATDPGTTMERCLTLVERHIGSFNTDRSTAWSQAFVEAVLEPVRGLCAQQMAQGLAHWQAVRPTSCGDTLNVVLRSHCAPVFEALKPVLPVVMSQQTWPDCPCGGWDILAGSTKWLVNQHPAHWRRVLQVLEESGLDVTGRLPVQGQDGGTTTLMHLVARVVANGVMDRLMSLLERGADPMALDHEGLTTVQRTQQGPMWPEVLDQWEDICRSHQARLVALSGIEAFEGARP